MIGGKLWCWLLRSHKFGKARDATWTNELVTEQRRAKVCKRCGLIRQVNRRAKQEKGI